MLRRLPTLLLLVLFAVMAFGGTFTCNGSTFDDDDHSSTRGN